MLIPKQINTTEVYTWYAVQSFFSIQNIYDFEQLFKLNYCFSLDILLFVGFLGYIASAQLFPSLILDRKSEFVDMLNDVEKKIIHYLQEDLLLTTRPFAAIAEKIGMGEEELLAGIRLLQKKGILRRLGATLYHQQAGFRANAMVAWCVPDGEVDDIGSLMAAFQEVSHCYQRKIEARWRYNLYTMVHGKTKSDCRDIVGKMAAKTGIKDYVVLFTLKEYKKTSPQYF